MKKLISLLILSGMLFFFTSNGYAQDTVSETPRTTATIPDTTLDSEEQSSGYNDSIANAASDLADLEDESIPLHQVFKEKFIEGGVPWMTPILLCLIFGLAIVIERIIYLNMATTNADKLLSKIETALNSGGVEDAKEICRNTRGPVASIFYQGISRFSEGIEIVEKSIISYGGVQMGRLEKGLTWIQLFIALAPMLGFLGTVVGMIIAFEDIETAIDMSPAVVAKGIKVALLTTVFGLIVAMILQVFYNYIVAKIDDIVNSMEDASISIIDLLVKYEHTKK
jgi:biopolymer transport protein ExbB